MLSAFAPWPESLSMTLSFAPDGTAVGARQSSLFQTLNQQFHTADWRDAILRAVQTWTAEANLNVGLVPDGGQAFGTLGLKEGDPRFGDIRIGAFPMPNDVLAVAHPYDPFVASTYVGDIFLNSNDNYGKMGGSAIDDLYGVVLHELGHVFGIGHSSNPASPMYDNFHANGPHALTTDDITALQQLYGTRTADAVEPSTGNASFPTATSLSLASPAIAGGSSTTPVDADLAMQSDVDTYRLTIPANVQGLNVEVECAGLSLLVPELTILDTSGNVVASSVATDSEHNNLSLTLDHATAGTTYYVQVRGAVPGQFDVGSYQLEFNVGGTLSDAEDSTGGSQASTLPEIDNRPTSLPASAQLQVTQPGYVEHTYYEVSGLVSKASPVQSIRIRSVDLGANTTNVMHVVLIADKPQMAVLQVGIFDEHGDRVHGMTVTQVGDKIEIQVPAVQSNHDYFIVLRGTKLGTGHANFLVTVNFSRDENSLWQLVSSTVDAHSPDSVRTLDVRQSQQFHFVLSTTDSKSPADSGVQMAVVNVSGQTVFSMFATNGESRFADIFLGRGMYTLRFSSTNSANTAKISFELRGYVVTEPLGPPLRDTTLQPVDSPALSPLPQLASFWLPGGRGPHPTAASIAGLPPAPLSVTINSGRATVPKAQASLAAFNIGVDTVGSIIAAPPFAPPNLMVAPRDEVEPVQVTDSALPPQTILSGRAAATGGDTELLLKTDAQPSPFPNPGDADEVFAAYAYNVREGDDHADPSPDVNDRASVMGLRGALVAASHTALSQAVQPRTEPHPWNYLIAVLLGLLTVPRQPEREAISIFEQIARRTRRRGVTALNAKSTPGG